MEQLENYSPFLIMNSVTGKLSSGEEGSLGQARDLWKRHKTTLVNYSLWILGQCHTSEPKIRASGLRSIKSAHGGKY